MLRVVRDVGCSMTTLVFSLLTAVLAGSAPPEARAQPFDDRAVHGLPVHGHSVHVIVAADSPIQELTALEVEQIFTARRLRVGPERVLVAVDPGAVEVYESLARAFTGRSARAFGMLWLEAGLRSAAPEPHRVDGDGEMIDFVAETPGAIGYTLDPDLPSAVRVVHTLKLDEHQHP